MTIVCGRVLFIVTVHRQFRMFFIIGLLTEAISLLKNTRLFVLVMAWARGQLKINLENFENTSIINP